MLLAGDIGGTKTALGLFDAAAGRPRAIAVRTYGTLDFADLPAMAAAFLNEVALSDIAIDRACFGVAGPVIDGAATLTNVPWRVDAREMTTAFGWRRVSLLNDLEAMAYAVPVLGESEVQVLQTGVALPAGNIALIAAGTGLGEGLLHNMDGRFVPSPSEGGHADFSARTEREIAIVRDLTRRYGRADLEHVVSERIIERIDEMLGRPTHDPHGDPIPTAEGAMPTRHHDSLLTCPLRTSLRMTRITDQDPAFLRFVERNGLKPGQVVEVESRDTAADSVRLVGHGGVSITIGARAASKLLVETTDS